MKRFVTFLLLFLIVLQAGCGGNGDRVLVSKSAYDPDFGVPERYDVVVFRYPEQPLKDGTPTNYIKRLLGLAAETIAIFFGQLFVTTEYKQPAEDREADPLDLWKKKYMHQNDAVELFKQGKFEILRKPPKVQLAMRRLVYDNDHQAKELREAGFPPRWSPEAGGWTANEANGFAHGGGPKKIEWLRYRHILPPPEWVDFKRNKEYKPRPQLITDFMSYNSGRSGQELRWAGSLMLEAELKVERTEGEFWLELSRGVDRFQARFDLGTGVCKLVRLQDKNAEAAGKNQAKEEELGSKQTSIRGAGTYRLRFANFDERLTLWVNHELPFGDGLAYPRAWKYDGKQTRWLNAGPTANDLRPASVASNGAAVQVHHLSLWRDTYYTIDSNGGASDARPYKSVLEGDGATDPSRWTVFEDAREMPVVTMFVQPGHYLCLGDNSPSSADSRTWGLVPERLMLGRALVVYYPFYFPAWPVHSDYNRVGVIH